MDGYRHEIELYNPYEPQPEAGPSTTEYKNEARTGLLTQSTGQRPEKSWLQHGVCFTLHGLLVCVHFLILLIWITRAEQHATVPIGRRSSIISTAIVQVSQIIGTLYLAGLIFVSQQLGTRRNARTRQTLTATSDNMAAWSGLGAALASLWRQKALVASLVPSLLVVGYFVCIAILNITTPAIFSLQPFNQTGSTVVATTLGKPNISVNSLAVSNPPTNFWLDSTSVVPYLAHSDPSSKIGLENGTLYDVISNNGGKGTASMNATTFNVSCGYIDNATVTDNGHLGNWSISTSYQETANSIPVLAPDAFKWLPLYPHALKDPWRHAVFYTSANITDSNGSNGVRVSLNPPMQPSAHIDQSRINASNFSETAVYSMQIIGCTISLINQSAAIDAESHLLQHVSPSGAKNTSQWSSWQPGSIPEKVSTVSASSQSTKIAGRAEETGPPAEQYNPIPTIADPVMTTTAAEGTDPITSPDNPTTNPYPTPAPPTAEATPPTTERYGTASIDEPLTTQTTTPSSDWTDTATSDLSLPTEPPVTPGPTSSEDLLTSTSSYSGASFAAPQNPNPTPADPVLAPTPAPPDSNPPPTSGDGNGGVGGAAPQDPNPNPAPPNNGGGGEGNPGEGNRTPQVAAPQDPTPNPAPPNNGGDSGNGDGGVGGAAPQDSTSKPAPPNNGEGGDGGGQLPSQNPGASAPQDSNPNPVPPSNGGTSGGDKPQFASPQDPSPNPAPPNNGGSPPQPQNPNPTPAPQNPNPNPAPANNNGGTPPQNSNPGSGDNGGVGGAAPQNPNPKPASLNNGDGGGGGAPQNSNPNPAPNGGGGDRNPQFASPQDPNPNPAPPNNGGGSNSGNGGGGNGGGGSGGNSGQGTNTPGQGQGQSNPPTAQSDSSGQGQSNPGQGATSPQGGGGQGLDGQQNSNFGAAGQPPSDNSNASPQNPPSAQGQDTTGGQQNPPGTGNPAPGGNGDTSNGNTPGQSNGADGAGQNGGGTGDGTQGTGGAGSTSGQDSGGQPGTGGTQGTGDTNRQGGGGQNGDAGDNSDGSQGAGRTGDTSGQGGGGQSGGAGSTGSNGSNSGAGGQGSVAGQPTSNSAEQPTAASNSAAVVTITSTTIVNATMTATAARSSGTPATVSYYDSSDVFLGVWWELFNQAALSRFPSTDDCPGHPWQNPDACNPFTVIEQFIMEDLGFYPVLLDSPVRTDSNVTLHDLENSLASATAASYWAALYTKSGGMKDSDPSNAANSNYKVAAAAGNATMEYQHTVMRLTINLTPLLMGQVASILLFILVWCLIGRPVRSDSGIETVGLLQIVWFIHQRPELQRIIADVDRPTIENLRKAGMVNMSLDGAGEEARPLAGVGE